MDIALTLTRKFAGEVWTLNGDDYEGLTWLSDTPKPTKAKLNTLWAEVQSEMQAEAAAKIASREELLARLGITAEEAKLLLS
jgi:hypothetical protein